MRNNVPDSSSANIFVNQVPSIQHFARTSVRLLLAFLPVAYARLGWLGVFLGHGDLDFIYYPLVVFIVHVHALFRGEVLHCFSFFCLVRYTYLEGCSYLGVGGIASDA